jgi:hypothetical protein
MEYEDFTIDLRSLEGGELEASVVESPLRDNPRVRFREPVERAVLDLLVGCFEASEAIIKERIHNLPISPREMGERVFTGLFKNGVGEHFRRCRDAAFHSRKEGLRLRLRFRTDDEMADYLAAVPWERMWEPKTSEHLATQRLTPVVREIAAPRRPGGLEVEPPLRILVVDAAPKTMARLNLKLEIDRMAEALETLVEGGQVELLRLENVTKDEMRDALLAEDIHILHFMGHGGYNPDSGLGAVFFENEDGTKDQVDGEMLAAYLKLEGRGSLRLVVLNACKTARHKGRLGGPLYNGVASTLLERTEVPAVIANQHSISDAAAIEFSRHMYGRIAAGDGVDEAITEARLRLWTRTQEWATPILYLTAPNGKVLKVQTIQRRKTVRVVRSRTKSEIELGIRSFAGWGGDMKRRNNDVLDLTPYFQDRAIKNEAWWQERVFPELRDFLLRWADPQRSLHLDFAAHSSIAFAAGWLLEPKSGLDVRVRQRTLQEREIEWHPHDGSELEAALWLETSDIPLDATAPDIAIAVSVSQPGVAGHVEKFVRGREDLPVGRILDATIAPEPGVRSVRGGAHALRLAQALLPLLHARLPHERGGCVHFFCSAPDAFVFYLGQLASSLGKIILYEHPFQEENAYGWYQRSIELPPPRRGPAPQ